MGLCQMTEPNPAVMADLVNSFYGWNLKPDDVAELGKSVLKKELAFNRAAGLSPATDRLPDFFKEEKLTPHQGIFDVSEVEIEKVLKF
jgi:aldehyde:ferredoxin oxidoreductase